MGEVGDEEVDFGGIVFLWRSGGGIGIDVDIPAWKDFRILVPMAKSANSLEKTQEAMSEDVSGTRRGCCGGRRVGKERVRCRVVPVAECVGRWRGRWRRCWTGKLE